MIAGQSAVSSASPDVKLDSSFTVFFFNAQSLCRKLSDLHDFIYTKSVLPLVVGIAETWFDPSIPDVCLNLPEYSILRFDRPTHGGGIMFLVRNCCNIIHSRQFAFGAIQVLCCDVEYLSPGSKVVRFVCVYRPPNTDMTSSLNFLRALQSEIATYNCNKLTIIMGDFNLTKIDWSVPCTLTNHTTADAKLLLFAQRCGFKQVVNEPTHDSNFTDLLFVSRDNIVIDVNVVMPFSTSDHNTVEVCLQSDIFGGACSVPFVIESAMHRPATNKLDFDNIDHAGLSSNLIVTDWSQIYSSNEHIDIVWEKFNQYIITLISKYTPLKPAFSRQFSPHQCLPRDILNLIRHKKAAWSLYKKHRRDSDKSTFKALAKLVRTRIEAYRKEREERILRSASIKQFYAYVREHVNPAVQIGPLRDVSGMLITNDRDKATTFNNFFHSVFTVDDNSAPAFALRTDAYMPMPIFTHNEVRVALCASKNSTSCGPDGCPAKFLKLFPELCLPLTDIFNLSIKQQCVPGAWKLANVVPIFKGKGSKLQVDNYRPISLSNVYCKLMESLISNKIVDYLNSNNLISQSQWGFRPGRSTMSQLVLAKSKLVDCFNDRACTDAVYTDLSKAFDSISHNKLIIKMHAYGINRNVCAWVADFLANRRQRVTVNNCLSDWLPCTSGVPQGSVLGPTLFNIYINDLPDCVQHSDILLYADDAKVFKRINCRLDCVFFQCDLDSIANWCALWQLKLNVSKCLSIRFGLVDRPSWDYNIAGTPLQKVTSTKDLGVVFDSKLSFSEHCHTIANKGFSRVNMLLRCFRSRDRELQIRLFNAFVRPIVEYASSVWSPHFVHDITVIEKVQKHFTKCLRGLHNKSYAERLITLNQPSLQTRRTRTDLIFLYKIIHGLVDSDLKELFTLSANVTVCDRSLRGHALKLQRPKPRTDMLKFDYVYRVIDVWNSLPAHVVEATSLSVFKQKLSLYLQ